MPSSSRSSSAKLFFGKQPMPCLPRNVKRRFGIWFSHKCHFVLHVTKAYKGGPVTAFANDGSYWPNMGRFCPNSPTLGEYREKHAYYMLYTSNALSTKTSKMIGAKLAQKTRNFCLWLETWGIYLENQYVTCTQPVLYQNQPILLQGWGKTMAVSENVKFFAPKQVLWVWKFQVG